MQRYQTHYETGLEKNIDAMFERTDAHFAEIMNGVIENIRREHRLNQIQAEMGRLAAQRREIDCQWEKLVAERVEIVS